jgi:serine/threonine protein kinase/Tol biopolymer transport system component
MSADRREALDRIFSEARQLPPDGREAFVVRSCGADVALRAEALSLLESDAASGEFLNKPALERLAQAMALEGWSLEPGQTIGPYTIQQLLGSGGVGEVWRARDERLRRDVAIKVLLPHFASDADRLSRFAEEARTTGALNHSNILTVYDIGEHHGIPYLVSECLEGRSLRQRLDAGPISVREALVIGLGVSRGLAAAHARSIVHRDLKPENTFLRSDGGVKILDFGLAKLQMSLDEPPAGTDHTLTSVIVGTAAYMAPEQVKGDTVDARADLFALGVMLYEMLAGQHPFRRSSTFETLHAVLTVDPPDLLSLNPHIPVTLDRIVMRLLQKTPDARFQSALDLIWALEQISPEPKPLAAPAARTSDSIHWWRSRRVLIGAAAGALALTAWALYPNSSREPRPVAVTRFRWALPSGMALGSAPMVSPDSRHIAFVGIGGKDTTGTRIYIRDRGSPEDVIPIPGTEDASHPFWSPDGTSLGFFARGRLMKVMWQGGAPTPVADQALAPFGGSWGRSETIVFAPDVIMSGLRRVATAGQPVEEATLLDLSLGDTSHCWPVFLPDGVHFLYFVRSAQDERRGVYIGRTDRPAASAESMLLRTDSNAVFVGLPGTDDGVLLYVVDGRVEARRLDPRTMRLSGDARTLAGVSAAGTTLTQPAMLSASPDMLVFASSTVPYRNANRLEVVDRSGTRLRFWETPEAQNWPRLSPDGQLLARQRVDPVRNTPDVWVEDLVRGPRLRVTTAIEPDIRPVWSPDGRYLAYVSGNLPFRPGKRTLNIAAADGTGVTRSFPCPGEYCEPTDWTPRGLLVNVLDGPSSDVWMVPTEPGAAPQPLLADTFVERDARISHDGRWVAYVSDESGRPEVSLRSIVGSPQRIVISSEGGDQPVWRRDGTELFFVDPEGQLRSVSVRWSRDGRPTLGLPTKLNVPPIGRGHWGTPYDVSPDGNRVYLLRRNDDPPPSDIHVIIGWRALLE